MTDRQDIADDAAARLRAFAAQAPRHPVLVGFDGFVDSIIHVVDRRHDENSFDRIPTIDRFGQKISAAAGHSGNFELVRAIEKLGGNGPIMAYALSAFDLPTTYVGATGYPEPHPAFEALTRRATVLGIGEPGMTDALEFDDGKLMLGKYDHLSRLGYEAIAQCVGDDRFRKLSRSARLIATVNWTMMPHLQDIWATFAADILSPGGDTIFFADLADPAKHAPETIRRAVKQLAELRSCARVVLGLNLSESNQVAAALGLKAPDDPEPAIARTAAALVERLDIDTVVIHPRRTAAAARRTDAGIETAQFDGPFTRTPKLSTGAGDNFNAGFCLGLLADMPLDQCLCTGNATSGYYVRMAASPSLTDLAEFCDDLPGTE